MRRLDLRVRNEDIRAINMSSPKNSKQLEAEYERLADDFRFLARHVRFSSNAKDAVDFATALKRKAERWLHVEERRAKLAKKSGARLTER